MVDTWQPSKGVLFFYLKYKGVEATRFFFGWREERQKAFFLGAGN